MFTIYKDRFMSGWGHAEAGSYVIVKGTIKRPEFKKVGSLNHKERHKYAIPSHGLYSYILCVRRFT